MYLSVKSRGDSAVKVALLSGRLNQPSSGMHPTGRAALLKFKMNY
jgi:hypothetical protein